jgi:hypothetical protein
MKTYKLILMGDTAREIRSWNTGNPRADLTAAMELAEGYVRMGCLMCVLCNGSLVWTNH